MTPDEVIDLLTTAAAYDRRKVGKADVVAWHQAVGDLDYLDAQDAVVGHYSESTEWLMPAHVRKRVKDIRAARLSLVPLPAPDPELAESPKDYQEALQQALSRQASAWPKPPKQITARAEPTEEYQQARGEDPHRDLRVVAIRVQCPHCHATAGDRCVNALNQPLGTAPAHDARLVEAGLARWVDVRGQQTAELLEDVR